MSDFNPKPPIPNGPPPPSWQQPVPTAPPGTAWQQPISPAPPRPAAELQSNGGLATAIVVLLVCWSAAKVLAIVAWFGQVSFLQRASSDPGSVSESEGAASDAFVGLAALLDTGLVVAIAVVLIIWLFRVRANAEVLSPLRHRRARGWLIAGWLVPVVNFWFPYQFMDDIWRASDPATRSQQVRAFKTSRIGWWWATFLTYSLVQNAGYRLIQRELAKLDRGRYRHDRGISPGDPERHFRQLRPDRDRSGRNRSSDSVYSDGATDQRVPGGAVPSVTAWHDHLQPRIRLAVRPYDRTPWKTFGSAWPARSWWISIRPGPGHFTSV